MAKNIERKESFTTKSGAKKPRQTWYAVLNVPRDVQRKVGKKRFRVALKTRDPKVAERLAAPLVAQWKAQIAEARTGVKHTENDARFWREVLQKAKTPEERLIAEDRLRDHVFMEGLDDTDPEAQRFYGEALGTLTRTTEHLDEWIGSLQVKDKTANMRRATVERLAAKFPMLSNVGRREVRRWVTDLIGEGLASATVQRMMTDCRMYWRYLETIEAVPEDSAPFDRLGLKVKRSARQPWTPEELVKLHRAAGETSLADLIKLAMYSGARLGELVSLKTDDVADDHFTITEAKTDAGQREVPIHREIAQTVARLVDQSKDGYLLPVSGKHRADTMSKAFQRLRKAEGHEGKQDKVFHSIRNTVITMLERAGVPEGTVQDIVGHERSTLTGGTYSGKSTLEMKADALARISYPIHETFGL